MRFSIRDLLWAMVVVSAALMWWTARQKANMAVSNRDEARARWHDAEEKWMEATRTKSEDWGGGAQRRGGGMGGATPTPPPAPGSSPPQSAD